MIEKLYHIFNSDEIDNHVLSEGRIYLAGHLEMPQVFVDHLVCVPEMGISDYACFTADVPHVHLTNFEFNYIAEGCTKLLILNERREGIEEHVLRKGSAFLLSPCVPYATKHQEGTRVVFFKTPGGNDKQLIEVSSALRRWLLCWDFTGKEAV